MPVKNLECLCNKPLHDCDKHCRAGEVFKRLNEKKAKLKQNDAELARDPNKMQKQLKVELNALQTGVEIFTNRANAVLTMRPKYDCLPNGAGALNPNFLTPNLKRRFGR